MTTIANLINQSRDNPVRVLFGYEAMLHIPFSSVENGNLVDIEHPVHQGMFYDVCFRIINEGKDSDTNDPFCIGVLFYQGKPVMLIQEVREYSSRRLIDSPWDMITNLVRRQLPSLKWTHVKAPDLYNEDRSLVWFDGVDLMQK